MFRSSVEQAQLVRNNRIVSDLKVEIIRIYGLCVPKLACSSFVSSSLFMNRDLLVKSRLVLSANEEHLLSLPFGAPFSIDVCVVFQQTLLSDSESEGQSGVFD